MGRIKLLKAIGKGLGAFSLFMCGYSVIMEIQWLSLICIGIGAVGMGVNEALNHYEN